MSHAIQEKWVVYSSYMPKCSVSFLLSASPPPLLDHFTSLQGQHNDALQTVQEQKNLIGQLETDIMHVQPYLPTRTEGEGQASPSSAEIISEALRDVQLETQRSSSKLLLHRSFQPHSQALRKEPGNEAKQLLCFHYR